MRVIGTALLLVLPALLAVARDESPSPRRAADQVLAVTAAGDREALKALAARDRPDPWRVAEELVFRGEHEAALAFAEAAPRPDTQKLPAYVAARKGRPLSAAARQALDEAEAAMRGGRATEALAALEGLDTKGDDVTSVYSLQTRGLALWRLRRLPEATQTLLAAAEKASRIGCLMRADNLLDAAAHAAFQGSDYRTAVGLCRRRVEVQKARGDRAGVGQTLGNLGLIHKSLGENREALRCQQEALKIARERKDLVAEAVVLGNLGILYEILGELERALECQERALAIEEEKRNAAGIAAILGNIGGIYASQGRYAEALEIQERALAIKEEEGDPATLAVSHKNLGHLRWRLGDHARALEHLRHGLELYRDLRDLSGEASTLIDLGNTHRSLGDYEKAYAYYDRALRLHEAIEDRRGLALSLSSLGDLHYLTGAYARALDHMHRALRMLEALGEPANLAGALNNLGAIYRRLGDYPRALRYQERALGIWEKVGNPGEAAVVRVNLGLLLRRMGENEKALQILEQSLKTFEDRKDRAGMAGVLGNLGALHGDLGAHERALECFERALALDREVGDRSGEAKTMELMGAQYLRRGDLARALATLEQARKLVAEIGSAEGETSVLWNLARAHLLTSRPREAVRTARRAVSLMSGLVGGLADEQGARAREEWTRAFEVGVAAGMALEDPAEVSYFLESGRAGSLLESLGGRERLQGRLVPEDLRAELAAARGAEAEARTLLAHASRAGKPEQTAARRAALDAARDEVWVAIQKIQREAKASAEVLYPEPAPLPEIQGSLGPDQTLVVYALMRERAVALVLTPEKARIVPLADSREIAALAEKLRWAGERGARGLGLPGEETAPTAEEAERIAAELRRAVVEPLDLPTEAETVLVSPHGALSYVPFALLCPDRHVAYVPSGTTLVRLVRDALEREGGKGVLALGDPYLGGDAQARASAIFRGGASLARLPGSKQEARLVGEVVLTGKEATESGFLAAVAKRPRWRAIHLACHGLMRPDRPMLSSLALAADAKNDGFLTALEVFKAKIPADLVVLSACETAKGKIYQAEGIVGLTRAFMFAGASRILCSLWKVDDQATLTLMTKFYELWNPEEGDGLPAAAALEKAQQFVRGHEKWKHPYYWAAWVLWGLPD